MQEIQGFACQRCIAKDIDKTEGPTKGIHTCWIAKHFAPKSLWKKDAKDTQAQKYVDGYKEIEAKLLNAGETIKQADPKRIPGARQTGEPDYQTNKFIQLNTFHYHEMHWLVCIQVRIQVSREGIKIEVHYNQNKPWGCKYDRNKYEQPSIWTLFTFLISKLYTVSICTLGA